MKYWLDSRINTTGLFFNHHHPLMVAWTVKVCYCFWVFIAFRRLWHDYYQLERLFSALFKVASPKGCFCQIRRFSVQSRNYTTGCFYASITALAVILCLDTKAFYLLFHSKSSNSNFATDVLNLTLRSIIANRSFLIFQVRCWLVAQPAFGMLLIGW